MQVVVWMDVWMDVCVCQKRIAAAIPPTCGPMVGSSTCTSPTANRGPPSYLRPNGGVQQLQARRRNSPARHRRQPPREGRSAADSRQPDSGLRLGFGRLQQCSPA